MAKTMLRSILKDIFLLIPCLTELWLLTIRVGLDLKHYFVIRQTENARSRNVARGSVVIKFTFVNALQTLQFHYL